MLQLFLNKSRFFSVGKITGPAACELHIIFLNKSTYEKKIEKITTANSKYV